MSTDIADDFVAKIKKALRSAKDHGRKSIESCVEAGEHLTKAKAALDHGEWYGWLEDNFEMTERTANNYMRLAEHADQIRNSVSDLPELSLRSALALIAKPKPAEKDGSEEEEGSEEEGGSEETSGETPEQSSAGPLEGEVMPPGRSPQQVAEDVARDAIHDVLQQCHWKQIDHLLAYQVLIKMLTEELRMVIPLSAEESAEARKAAHAAAEESRAEEEPPAKKKRGRPEGSKNRPKAEEAPPDPVEETAGAQAAPQEHDDAPSPAPPPDDLTIPESMRRY